MRGTTLGINEEFVAAPKLDDLECAYSSIEGMLNAKLSKDYVTVCAVFDNEEVGSETKQGAASTFLYDTLYRINESLEVVQNRGLDQHFSQRY